jgi:adenosylmethionine-8-amino-7-oxononanoate aminotransferase
MSTPWASRSTVSSKRDLELTRGIELVKDRASKTPFDPATKVWAKVKRAAMERGLICYPMGGVIDGSRGDHVLLAPPYIIDEAQLDELVEKLAGAIDAGIKSN